MPLEMDVSASAVARMMVGGRRVADLFPEIEVRGTLPEMDENELKTSRSHTESCKLLLSIFEVVQIIHKVSHLL